MEALKDWWYMKGKQISVMPFLPRTMSGSRIVTLELRMANKPHGTNWRDIHNLKDDPYQPAKDDDDIIDFKDEDLKVRCQLNGNKAEEKIVPRDFLKGRHTVYFLLDFNGKPDDSPVSLEIIHSKLHLEIIFISRFNEPPVLPGMTSVAKPVEFDDILGVIAKRTKQDADTDDLGRALDIPIDDIDSAKVGNRHGETHMGTLNMLKAWRKGQRPSEEVGNLQAALRKANMNRLLSEVFPEADTDQYCSEDTFDKRGGELRIPSQGATLSIPPGALEEGVSETISLEILGDKPRDIQLRDDEMVVTKSFQCLPSGLQFAAGKPAKLTLPHCVNLIDPQKVQVVLYSWTHEGDGKCKAERKLQSPSSCRVTPHYVEISLEHFTPWFVTFKIDWRYTSGKRMSFMPFLPRTMTPSRIVTLQLRMVSTPHGTDWRDTHDLTGILYQPAKDNDDIMNVKDKDLKITCKLDANVVEIKNVDRAFLKDNNTEYFLLDFNGKPDDSPVSLKIIHSGLEKDILFISRFTEPAGLSGTCSMGATIDDLTLDRLGDALGNNPALNTLGLNLGFLESQVNMYLATNRVDGTVSSTGTKNMLVAWKNKTPGASQVQELRNALMNSNLGHIAETYLN